MSWTVSYSYGSICDALTFDDEDEAQHFYELIQARIEEFGDGGEYESQVELIENEVNTEENK